MAPLRALVVEDAALILLGLEMILEDAGMEIVGTASTIVSSEKSSVLKQAEPLVSAMWSAWGAGA